MALRGRSRARRMLIIGVYSDHLGPDGAGIWESDRPGSPLVLGHHRLAIRGLGEQGAQPMVSADGVLSFNGELFGMDPLRSALLQQGRPFRGSSDTEVLLNALGAWGMPTALDRIRGQFAFLWWDRRDGRLYFARDRVGIRPLYIAVQGDRLAAASEQKALLTVPWVDATPALEGMLRYLIMARTDDVDRKTLLQGVTSLPAGHWGAWDGETLRIDAYHRFSTEVPTTNVEDVRRELARAVSEQLVSDVPVGATLSGGLDSSAVTLLADAERLKRDDRSVLHLFAYHDNAAEADERAYQQAVIEAVRSPHQVHWVSSSPEELANHFDAYIEAQEEPYGDVSSYAESCLSAEARRSGVKVLLNGLGGDEVFVGYLPYIGPLMLDVLLGGDRRAVWDLLRVAPEILGTGNDYSRPLFAAAYHALPSRVRNVATAWRNSRSLGLATPLRLTALRDAWNHWHTHDGNGHANAALRGSIESWSVPRFLLHSDRMGLMHGVESRVPLLDDGVIRAGFGIPPALRIGKSGLKSALRMALWDVLPPLVRDRKWKLGFHAPLGVYVRALDARLREGHRVVLRVLGSGPAWDDLDASGRWRFGNLGAYLTSVETMKSASQQ